MITNKIVGIFGKSKSLRELLDEKKGLQKSASTGAKDSEDNVKPSSEEIVTAKKGELPPWLKKDYKKEDKKEDKDDKKEDEEDKECKDKKEDKKEDKKDDKKEDKDDKECKDKKEDKEDKKEEKEAAISKQYKCPKCAAVTATTESMFSCSKCGKKLKTPAKIEKETCAASAPSFVKLSALSQDQRKWLSDYWKRLYPAAYVDAMLSNY